MRLAGAVGFLFAIIGAAHAQPADSDTSGYVDPPADADLKFFVRALERWNCEPVPGDFIGSIGADGKPVWSNAAHRQRVEAFQKAGLVRISFDSKDGVQGLFRLQLTAGVDEISVRSNNGARCLVRFRYSPAQAFIIGVRPVSGGTTGWTGISAIVGVTGQEPMPLYARFIANGGPALPASNGQYRVLFRPGPDGKSWNLVTWDDAGNGDSAVSKALEID
jgi:hypothetical protein